MSLNLSRKRKKELKKLQSSANKLWESQQVLVGDAAGVAREAGRQLGSFNREQIQPIVQDKYEHYVAPVVQRGAKFVDHRVVPAVGGALGKAMSAWDVANDTRVKIGSERFGRTVVQPKRRNTGAVIAIVLGIAAAAGVLYAAWQTLRADDELWVADDPLAAPES